MSNRKITYKNLIIIMIIVFIISAILINVLKRTYTMNKLGKFISDMEILEEQINYLDAEYLLWENYNPNDAGNFSTYLQSKNFINANSASNIYIEDFQKIIEEFSKNTPTHWNKNLDQILSNYCYFSPTTVLENFNIESTDYYIIINFYTGNIICKNGIKYNGKTFFRHYDLKETLEIKTYQTDIIPEINIVENNGLNKKVKISLGDNVNISNIAEIYYLVGDDDEKKRCTELLDYQYIAEERASYFTINTSGKYQFIVEDTNYIQYPKITIDITLCNKPILESGMQGIYFDESNNEMVIENIKDPNWYNYSDVNFKPAYAKKSDDTYWVWLPRFIYKQLQTEEKIDFVYNISQTSTTNKSTINYELPQIFESEITGIWINEKNLTYYTTQKTDFFKKVLTNQ